MCLNYLFSCRARGKQFTDKTADRFIYRWNNYKMEARKAESGDMENVKQKGDHLLIILCILYNIHISSYSTEENDNIFRKIFQLTAFFSYIFLK